MIEFAQACFRKILLNQRDLYQCFGLLEACTAPSALFVLGLQLGLKTSGLRLYFLSPESASPTCHFIMSLPTHKPMIRTSTPSLRARMLDSLNNLVGRIADILILISTLLYHNALERNTLNPISDIRKEQDATRRKDLISHFLAFKINESKYVQVAVSIPLTLPTNLSC